MHKTSSGFHEKVYRIVLGIPEGKVATYGQIAVMLGCPRAARAVGTAMQRAPEYLQMPCHRVVSSSGKLAPAYAFGGQEEQRLRLLKEGVLFKGNGCVDLSASQWKPGGRKEDVPRCQTE